MCVKGHVQTVVDVVKQVVSQDAAEVSQGHKRNEWMLMAHHLQCFHSCYCCCQITSVSFLHVQHRMRRTCQWANTQPVCRYNLPCSLFTSALCHHHCTSHNSTTNNKWNEMHVLLLNSGCSPPVSCLRCLSSSFLPILDNHLICSERRLLCRDPLSVFLFFFFFFF